MWLTLIPLAVFIVFFTILCFLSPSDYWWGSNILSFLVKSFFNSLCGVEQATHRLMTLPCTVSSKLNQKLSILNVKFFISTHDGGCPSILHEQMNVNMSLTQCFKAWWKLPIHLIWADECPHVTHTVVQGWAKILSPNPAPMRKLFPTSRANKWIKTLN
jgi:hypothetical protein